MIRKPLSVSSSVERKVPCSFCTLSDFRFKLLPIAEMINPETGIKMKTNTVLVIALVSFLYRCDMFFFLCHRHCFLVAVPKCLFYHGSFDSIHQRSCMYHYPLLGQRYMEITKNYTSGSQQWVVLNDAYLKVTQLCVQ